MVERLVYLGSSTQVNLRLAAGADLQALLQNDGAQSQLPSQGTPVHAYLAADALRVLSGGASGRRRRPAAGRLAPRPKTRRGQLSPGLPARGSARRP